MGDRERRVRVDMRLPEELLAWLDEYAAGRGSNRTAVMEAALIGFREDCERGVPELRRLAREQAANAHATVETGVGSCPEREEGLGHVWRLDAARVNRCIFCAMLGRDYLQSASAGRADLFRSLKAPASVRGGRPKS